MRACGFSCGIILGIVIAMIAAGVGVAYYFCRKEPDKARVHLTQAEKQWSSVKNQGDKVFDAVKPLIPESPAETRGDRYDRGERSEPPHERPYHRPPPPPSPPSYNKNRR